MRILVPALLLGGLLVAAPAHAAPPAAPANPHLQAALTAIGEGRLDDARADLKQAMAWPRNSNALLVEIYRNLAVVDLYAGEDNRAYEALARLLNIDPEYTLPPHAAKSLVDLFDRVKDAYAQGLLKPVRVAHEAPGQVPSDAPVTLSATVSNMQSGFKVALHLRRAGAKRFHVEAMSERPGNRYVAVVQPVHLAPGAKPVVLQYYIEVTDAEGRRVQGVGNALEPLTLTVEPPAPAVAVAAPPAWYTNPWIWVGVGVVVAGGATAAVIASQGPSTGSLPVTVKVGP